MHDNDDFALLLEEFNELSRVLWSRFVSWADSLARSRVGGGRDGLENFPSHFAHSLDLPVCYVDDNTMEVEGEMLYFHFLTQHDCSCEVFFSSLDFFFRPPHASPPLPPGHISSPQNVRSVLRQRPTEEKFIVYNLRCSSDVSAQKCLGFCSGSLHSRPTAKWQLAFLRIFFLHFFRDGAMSSSLLLCARERTNCARRLEAKQKWQEKHRNIDWIWFNEQSDSRVVQFCSLLDEHKIYIMQFSKKKKL